MERYMQFKLKAQRAILQSIEKEYPHHTVGNVIKQIDSRIKHIEEKNG